MHTPVNVLIADDHPLFRKGLRQAIEADPQLRVVHEAGDGLCALRAIAGLRPDVSVLDVRMPKLDGLEVVRSIRQQGLNTQPVFLTMYRERDLVEAALALDVRGYVLKESAVEDILECIWSVCSGHRYISPCMSVYLVERSEGLRASGTPGLARLTAAERRILRLIAADKTSKEIAATLRLSPRTVENHRTNMCAKLDVHGIHSLVKFAYENKGQL